MAEGAEVAPLVQAPPKLPAERADRELDPESAMHDLLFDPDRTADWIERLLTIPSERGPIVDFNLYPQKRLMLSEHTGRDDVVLERAGGEELLPRPLRAHGRIGVSRHGGCTSVLNGCTSRVDLTGVTHVSI